jgi:hypothetical protein
MNGKPLAHIALTRRPEHLGLGSFMNFKVFVDGKTVAYIPYAKRVVIPIEPGAHEIHIKMEISYSKSEPIFIQASDGAKIELNCGYRFHGWTWILNLILPSTLEIKNGGFNIDNVVSPLKLPLLFLLPTILMPVFLFYMALIISVLWIQKDSSNPYLALILLSHSCHLYFLVSAYSSAS